MLKAKLAKIQAIKKEKRLVKEEILTIEKNVKINTYKGERSLMVRNKFQLREGTLSKLKKTGYHVAVAAMPRNYFIYEITW